MQVLSHPGHGGLESLKKMNRRPLKLFFCLFFEALKTSPSNVEHKSLCRRLHACLCFVIAWIHLWCTVIYITMHRLYMHPRQQTSKKYKRNDCSSCMCLCSQHSTITISDASGIWCHLHMPGNIFWGAAGLMGCAYSKHIVDIYLIYNKIFSIVACAEGEVQLAQLSGNIFLEHSSWC